MATLKKALNYVHNAGGNATPASMADDYAPIGWRLFQEVKDAGFIEVTPEYNLKLTEEGVRKREELNAPNQSK